MRRVGVVTGGRADYGIVSPLLHGIINEPSLELLLYVTGTHLSPEFGFTVKQIEADGYPIAERIEMMLSSDSPEGVSKAMGIGTMGFAQVFAKSCPDILVVVGDRFESHAAAVAAVPFKIPIAHIHGGELTEGAIDDALRHSITKLSHLHFASTETYAKNILELGEESWRVTVSGAPSLDNIHTVELLDISALEKRTGICLCPAPLLVTFHPVTLEYEKTEEHVFEVLEALRQFDRPMVLSLPNADTHGRVIRKHFEAFAAENPFVVLLDNLGTQAYFSLMAVAGAMVGNSSSGIIEAGTFQLPVVNIGTRQRGRVRGKNVIDVGTKASEIQKGIKKALHPKARKSLTNFVNPYGIGNASQQIIQKIKSINLDDRLLKKQFYPQVVLREKVRMSVEVH